MEKRFSMFTHLILRLYRIVLKIKQVEMKSIGLNADHADCLLCLYKSNEGLSQAELVKLTYIDKASISRDIEQLKNKNYVIIEQEDKNKKYNAKIFLTDEGKEIAKIVTSKIEKAVEVGSNGLSEQEEGIFYKALELVDNNLTEYVKKGLK